MPTVIVKRDALFKQIGRTFTDEEFDELCFEFGIELDEITTEKEMYESEQNKKKEGLSEEVLYKIEVSANRYDLLCIEGLALSLKTFLDIAKFPLFKSNTIESPTHYLNAENTVNEVRPYVCAAILRNIKFTQETLIGFMELQDKLHNNICRGRTLVSMGTHDLDTVTGPFRYAGLKPESFKFVPLNRKESVNGVELLELLSADAKLKHYVHLLKNEPLFPAILDSEGRIMSIPPLINSEHSKIRIETRNVFIDVTAKDITKANIVLNTLIAMFSVYCVEQFTVEEVVVTNASGEKVTYPDLKLKTFDTNIDYLNRIAGTDLKIETVTKLLTRMGLETEINDEKNLTVKVPITRSDVIHACDIAEDLAISYGYNNIVKSKPKTICNGYQQPLNKLTDLMRLELAMSGYTECLTTALVSKQDLFTNMLEEISKEALSSCVQIFKSKSSEFEVVRTNLIPGILKTIEANKSHELPYQVFEISDVVLVDDSNEAGARNRRKLCFAYTNTTSGFEVVHGMVDQIMSKLSLPYNDRDNGYYIEASNEKILFGDRQAHLYIKGVKAGLFGIVHPLVLKNFGIKNPVSIAELDIEYVFDLIINGEILRK